MNDDVLARATRALREETQGDDASARLTRSRIMAGVAERRVRRRTRVAFLLPIAATFVAASALGATGSGRQALAGLARALGLPVGPAATAAPPPARPAPIRRAAPAPEPAVDRAPEPAPPAEPEPGPEPDPAPARVPEVAAALAPEPARSATSADPAFDLYRAAHHAHFVERDPAQALAAWDAYLKRAPRGSFALEARYNRALCLLRLQRTAEARVALTPFAEGRYQGYRQGEARELIDALPENQ